MSLPGFPTATAWVDAFSALFVVCTVVMMAHRSLLPTVRMYALQSALLALIALTMAIDKRSWHLLVPATLTFAVKAVAIPRFFAYVIERIHIRREAQPYVNLSVGLIAAGALALAAYWIVRPIPPAPGVASHALTASLTVVFLGLFLMVSRRKAITQTLGLLVMENGMFLAGLSLTYGMPLIVELGIAFDVLVAVIVAGLLIFNINRTFDSLDVGRLSTLAEGRE